MVALAVLIVTSGFGITYYLGGRIDKAQENSFEYADKMEARLNVKLDRIDQKLDKLTMIPPTKEK